MNEAEEAALVGASLRGEREAFGKLVDAYGGPVFNIALRIVGNREDASDVAQETFLRAWEGLGSFEPGRRFFSWIYRIAVHESLDLLGRRRREEPLGDPAAPAGRSPEDALREDDVVRMVQAALMEIKPEYRTVVVLRHFRRCSYHDMAAILGIPEKTVKSRLFTARQLLKRVLAARGVR